MNLKEIDVETIQSKLKIRNEQLDKAFTDILTIIFENKITLYEVKYNDLIDSIKEEADMN